VPIWCAVINRAIPLRGGRFVDVEVPLPLSSSDVDVATADTDTDTDLDLHTPPGAVSPHEHAQIAARLDIWAAGLAVSYVPPARFCTRLLTPQCTHRTRRMHSLNCLGRCALCGLRPLRRAFLASRQTLRSCLLYA
jgi:Rit1 N-terminal domain